jgi:hypothetical protein
MVTKTLLPCKVGKRAPSNLIGPFAMADLSELDISHDSHQWYSLSPRAPAAPPCAETGTPFREAKPGRAM